MYTVYRRPGRYVEEVEEKYVAKFQSLPQAAQPLQYNYFLFKNCFYLLTYYYFKKCDTVEVTAYNYMANDKKIPTNFM
jgi:hypothetical protein